MNELYTQDLTDCFASDIGDGGLDLPDFEHYLAQAKACLDGIRASAVGGELRFLELPSKQDDLAEIFEIADRYRQDFRDVVILGTGGSSLGGQTLCALAENPFIAASGGPRLHFVENIDPHTSDLLIDSLDWSRTGVIAISKSGSTAETMAQTAVVADVLKRTVGEAEVRRHLTAVTELRDTPLNALAVELGCPVLPHDPDIGGRYSALSVTGLLPARICGLDIADIRAGAESVVRTVLDSTENERLAPVAGAAATVALQRTKGIAATVLMPYSDRLTRFGLWFRQLWAESLGKSGEGMIPVCATGTVDQHSQLQLYLDGPADKMFSLVLTDTASTGARIPADVAGSDGLSYLDGRTIGDLMAAAGQATADTLANNGRPTRVLRLSAIDEATMGALMMHFMLETVVAAGMIGVNAFDQPAVEEGKALTRSYLAKGRSA